tara:strand:- start:16961 stop:17833 length:873 start_codon:yes stop_codon:yes gene_type:complete
VLAGLTFLYDGAFKNLPHVYGAYSNAFDWVSVGINLNLNKGCDQRCVYCHVPGLVSRAPQAVNVDEVLQELEAALHSLSSSPLRSKFPALASDGISNVAICGDGEPTLCPNIDEMTVGLSDFLRSSRFDISIGPLVMFTNGHFLRKKRVRRALQGMSRTGSQLWVKIDAVSPERQLKVNGFAHPIGRQVDGIVAASEFVDIQIKSCLVSFGAALDAGEAKRLCDVYRELASRCAGTLSVDLYTINRPSRQNADVRPVSQAQLDEIGSMVRALGINVFVSDCGNYYSPNGT